MSSSNPVFATTALILPLDAQEQLFDPSPYLPAIRQVVRATSKSILIVFHGQHVRKLSPTTTWEPMQAFLGVVYGAAAQEAASLDRVLMDVDVCIQGFDGGVELQEGVLSRLRGAEKVFAVEAEGSSLEIAANGQRIEYLSAFQPFKTSQSPSNQLVDSATPSRFPVTALGGTFDHLHAGHKVLLSMAVFVTSRKLIVGMSDDPLLVSKSNADLLEPISTRSSRVHDFLRLTNPRLEYDVVAIQDVYGPTAWEEDIQALVVSKESVGGGKMIDAERSRKGLSPLHHLVIDVISSSSSNLELSGETDANVLKELKMGSTYIRQWLAAKRRQEQTDQAR